MVNEFTGIGNRRGDDGALRSLLIVDDDDLELCLLSAQLSAAGYAVTTAQNGADACELLRQQSFPVVITDYQMPIMDGLQLVDRVREQEADRNYFIVWSICATQADRDRSFSHGADDHLSKQAPNPELLARIETGFSTIARRESLQRARMMRSCGAMFGRNRDTDTWSVSAIRLHTEIAKAARRKKPLAVLLLHVERQLTPREKPLLTLTQFSCLMSAINSVLRLNVDFVLPLDASEGLVRVLLVLPATTLREARLIRDRLYTVLDEPVIDVLGDVLDESITADFSALPDCAIGVAAIESWGNSTTVNAAALVAAAEHYMEELTLPAM